MKVKRLREDFVVTELSTLPLNGGSHAVYRLQKSGIGTPEAITEVLNIWNFPRASVAYAGLKDRHATTSQTITIEGGPREPIQQSGFSLEYLGQSRRGITAADIVGNRFEVALRELEEPKALHLAGVLNGMRGSLPDHSLPQDSVQAADSGLPTRSALAVVPNYFDDQRFGSLGESGQFIAQPWCLGDYERALFLAIAEANPHDRPNDRGQKEILREHWGDWVACKQMLERSHRRSIVTYLVDHPSGFKKAVGLIRQDLRSFYVAAFQSKLWNEVVVRLLPQWLPSSEFVSAYGTGGKLLFPITINAGELATVSKMRIALPSGRKAEWPADIAEKLDEVLAEFGIPRHKLRFSYPRDVFFARAQRDVWLTPLGLECEVAKDELAAAPMKKLVLRFQLPPGQYATMLIKAAEMLSAHYT